MKNHAGLIKKWILLSIFQVLAFAIILKGCGDREVYDISVFAFLSFLICTRKKIFYSIIPICMLIMHVFMPGVSLLWGYCLLMFSLDKRTLHCAALSSMLWICECFNIIPYTLTAIDILNGQSLHVALSLLYSLYIQCLGSHLKRMLRNM